MTTMTRPEESTAPTSCLLLAFELGERTWKLGFTVGVGQRPRMRQIPAGVLDRVWTEIAEAKARSKVAADTPVIWIHRALVAQGVTNYVVDSSSIEVNRRARRTKSDRLDLGGLLALLARYAAGDRRCWRVVRVPLDGICIGRGKRCNKTARASSTGCKGCG
jgi:transposase